jgi:hypothetical protein
MVNKIVLFLELAKIRSSGWRFGLLQWILPMLYDAIAQISEGKTKKCLKIKLHQSPAVFPLP